MIPQVVKDFCNGRDLETKLCEAIRLSSVDEDGWPHSAMLSAGEVLAYGDVEFTLATWPGSQTAKNLERDGRSTLTMAGDGGLYEFRLRTELVFAPKTSLNLKFFRAHVLKIQKHAAKYAQVNSGVTFRITPGQEESVLDRWKEQLKALHAISAAESDT